MHLISRADFILISTKELFLCYKIDHTGKFFRLIVELEKKFGKNGRICCVSLSKPV